jgi:hypothetical protein
MVTADSVSVFFALQPTNIHVADTAAANSKNFMISPDRNSFLLKI